MSIKIYRKSKDRIKKEKKRIGKHSYKIWMEGVVEEISSTHKKKIVSVSIKDSVTKMNTVNTFELFVDHNLGGGCWISNFYVHYKDDKHKKVDEELVTWFEELYFDEINEWDERTHLIKLLYDKLDKINQVFQRESWSDSEIEEIYKKYVVE